MKTLLSNCKCWIKEKKFAGSLGFDDVSGKIISVGPENKINKKDFDKIIDLSGKLVLPAFTEGHCHLVKGSLVNFSEINLCNAATVKDFTEQINIYKKNLKKNDWIVGGNFSETNFREEFELDRYFLDEICSDVPVILSRLDLHSAFMNSKAIELSGMKNKISEFGLSEIVCDDKGELTGEVKERARFFALDSVPQKTTEQLSGFVKMEIEKMNSLGITSVSDVTWDGELAIYKSLLHRNEMNLKINSMLRFQAFPEIENLIKEFSEYSNKIRLNTFKEFYDGSLSSKSAYFRSNYKGENHNGLKTNIIDSGEFEKIAIEIDKAGYQFAVHAIGDKAVSELLDFNEKLIKINGKRERRFRIEHAQHIDNNDLIRFKTLDIITSVQPSHLYVDAKVASEVLDNPGNTHIYKKIMESGAVVNFGTDFPVAVENPFETIYYAMTRKANGFPDGFNTEFSIDLVNCLKAYTFNNAYASFGENEKGSLETGKYADFIVTDRDIFTSTPEEIKETKVLVTYLNGKRIH
ncbi:MAG: amidohydrolase [Ignavibacteriae bacterium]|nr:amidohydrolase [Ignavibacteriota bacterium]